MNIAIIPQAFAQVSPCISGTHEEKVKEQREMMFIIKLLCYQHRVAALLYTSFHFMHTNFR